MKQNKESSLSTEEIDVLRAIPTPSVANAIESFGIRPPTTGFSGPSIHAIAPNLPPIIGFAVTARTIAASFDPRSHPPVTRLEYYRYIQSATFAPRIAVIQDLTDRPDLGGFFGEVNANVHRALGCVGGITNSAVRDLTEMEALGFATWASGVQVAHDVVNMVDCGVPVIVGGLLIHHGDLLLADIHGVIQIPFQLIREIPERVRNLDLRERDLIYFCRCSEFSPEGFADLLAKKKRG